MKNIQLMDVFYPHQIAALQGLKEDHAKLVEYLTPLMPQINSATKQENDVRYWAYMIQHFMK